MIEFSDFAYTEAQWDAIKVVVRDALGVDADIQRLGPPLRASIEVAASMYHYSNDRIRQRPRRDDLLVLHRKVENVQASIVDVLTVRIATENGVSRLTRDGVEAGMVSATRDYFAKLLHNIDGMIAQSGSRRDNARKTARDQCWNELLAIWCDLGGEPSGKAAAEFIRTASLPVMGSAVPALASVEKLLERRQNKTAKTVKSVLRRATG